MITINVKEKTWEDLNQRKRAGETFDDVINRMILEFPKYKKLPKNQTIKDIKKEVKK